MQSMENNGLDQPKASPGLLPVAPRKHNRTVSWDVAVGDLTRTPPVSKGTARADESPGGAAPLQEVYAPLLEENEQLSPASKQSEDVLTTLKEIQGQSPMESEAEAYLLSTLEETDPTVPGHSEAQRGLLSEVGENEENIFQPKPTSEAVGTKDAAFRQSVATGEALLTLTKELQSMQDMPILEEDEEENFFENETQTEKFARNAANLMLRKKKSEKNQQDPEVPSMDLSTTEDSEDHADPKSKWTKLRTAVFATNAVADTVEPKKNDDSLQVPQEKKEELDLEAGERPPNSIRNNRREDLRKSVVVKAKEEIQSDFHEFKAWLVFQRKSLFGQIKFVLLYLIIPSAAIAALLFYALDNPPCGTQAECLENSAMFNRTSAISEVFGRFGDPGVRYDDASASWWFLFIGVRQVITLCLARMTESFIIEFLTLRTQLTTKLFGPFVALFVVQSKGWPIRFVLWAVYDFALLYGDRKFARHWLYWQSAIDLMNKTNPGGNVTTSDSYKNLLIVFIVVGFTTAVKRFVVGLILGKKTYIRYADDLAKLMQKTLLVGQVAKLAKDVAKYDFRVDEFDVHTDIYNHTNIDEESKTSSTRLGPSLRSLKSGKSAASLVTGVDLTGSQKVKVEKLLGQWEEPDQGKKETENVDIGSIIQFRQSLSFLNSTHPFSVAFGLADTRENCAASSERAYNKLRQSSPDNELLSFDTLALLGVNKDGSLNEQKLKALVKLFRPDREGNLSRLDFCKSVDSVYKELRLLRAAVANAARVDRSFEKIINIVFYIILFCVALAILGLDPMALFIAISGFILGFAFMIGSACSKYFEGILMILVRKPYDIGDKICVASADSASEATGSSFWIIKDVGLYHTTYVFWTGETATVSNGAIAGSRIINATRSPQAVLTLLFKFPLDVPYKKVELFKASIQKFIKDRPREWISFLAFRPTRIETDFGYVEYKVVAQHREVWANTGALNDSKALLSSFGLELQKKLGMRYVSPPKPIDLRVSPAERVAVEEAMRRMPFSQDGLRPRTGTEGSVDINASFDSEVQFVEAMFAPKKD